MYRYGQNLIDDPTGNGFCTERLLTVNPHLEYPFDRDKSAIIYRDEYIVHPDCFTPLPVGACHPNLKQVISGTVAMSNGSTLMTSSTIDFTAHFQEGDVVYLNSQVLEVSTLTSDQLVTTQNYTGISVSNATIQRSKAFLVSEGGFDFDDSGLLHFERTYATIPDGRTEFSTAGFSFPAYRTLSTEDGNPERSSFNQVVVAKEVYSYVRTNDPENTLSVSTQFLPVDSAGNQTDFVANDTVPTRADYEALVTSSGYIQANETQIVPWMGNIWELKNTLIIAK